MEWAGVWIELVLVFGLAAAWGARELWILERYKKADREKREERERAASESEESGS